jgi:hypothetical protein
VASSCHARFFSRFEILKLILAHLFFMPHDDHAIHSLAAAEKKPSSGPPEYLFGPIQGNLANFGIRYGLWVTPMGSALILCC